MIFVSNFSSSAFAAAKRKSQRKHQKHSLHSLTLSHQLCSENLNIDIAKKLSI